MSKRLAGRTILLTGASSGIGRATAKALVQSGAHVIGVSRRPASIPEGVTALQADLTRREEITHLFDRLEQIDGLVNCAGIAYLSRLIDGNPTDWEEMWRVNVFALALCCQSAIRRFPKSGGRIVNVSSMSGHRVPPSGGFYSPPKFAVRAYTRCQKCGRPHSVYRKFGLCRVCFREMAHNGELPGITKSSW